MSPAAHRFAPLERSELEQTLVRRTPLVEVRSDAWPGALGLKLENLQRTGSFKLRGAARKLARLSAAERARGVVAASAGNHGAGLALAAARCQVAATVVVPEHTPANKRERIAGLGAEIVVRGASYDAAEALARRMAEERGQVFVSPFDDDDIIAGNGGTLADELWEQSGGALGAVVCPVGGGGLVAGLAERLAPRGVRVIGVQPEKNCAMHRSLELGEAQLVYHGQPTAAEGCEGAVAERTFAAVRDHGVAITLVSEAAIFGAVAFCYRRVGTLVECSGAVALAAFLCGLLEPSATGVTACVVTGGNIDPEALDQILAQTS